jgi:putative heme transporter
MWPWLKYVAGLALAALALWALAGRRGELSGATHYLSRLNWAWLVTGVVAEAGSLMAFGILQRRLLEAGRVRMGVGRVTAVTVAATAISNSMPAGPVVSSLFAFRQYRRQGADEAFAGWTLAAVFVAASVSLALVAAVGLVVAGAEGAGFDLVWVTIVVLVAALALGALFLQGRVLVWSASKLVDGSRRVLHWPPEETVARLHPLLERLSLVKLTPLQVLSVTSWGVANWILDCGCLALSFIALGFGVPWKALLLAYGAGQLAVNLPITPGGLGVVEGSMTIALVIFGGAQTQTVAAVLLYRIISFWLELPVGWAAWAAITLQNRRSPVGPGTVTVDEHIAEATQR